MPDTAWIDHVSALAKTARALWDIPQSAGLELINISENATFLITDPAGFKAVLRVHRQGYHTQGAIAAELAWMDALRSDGVIETPVAIAGRNGQVIQVLDTPDPGFMVLFAFIPGAAPDETGDLIPLYEELGAIAARCHAHALTWTRPAGFERLTWDEDAVFGPTPTWGDWRDAPGVDPDVARALEEVEERIKDRIQRYGKAPDRFNLIHADMRFANLLVDRGQTRLIDFDDCGFGWLMYDFAAAISFIEDDPRRPEFKDAWVRGYRRLRTLPDADVAEIDTFVMLRRMALLAWIGSHMEAPEPQALAPHFAAGTARLGQAWLESL